MRPLVRQDTNGAVAAGATLDLLAGNSVGQAINRALNAGFLTAAVECAAAGDVTVTITVNTQEVASFRAGQSAAFPDIRRAQAKNIFIGPQDVRGVIDVTARNNGGAAVAIFWLIQLTPTQVQ